MSNIQDVLPSNPLVPLDITNQDKKESSAEAILDKPEKKKQTLVLQYFHRPRQRPMT
jgi:hypothetical protein